MKIIAPSTLLSLTGLCCMATTAQETAPVTETSDLKEKEAPTCTKTPTQEAQYQVLEHILAEDYEEIDPTLPASIKQLKARGAHRCWHKHSTFLAHLLGVHNILRLWGQSPSVGRLGLFHSAYSNSYVNLALFDPKVDSERQLLRDAVGDDSEDLVHTFCIIDRQAIVVNTLLKTGVIPAEGVTVPHLRYPDTETVYMSPSMLQTLVVFSMADIADQYFGWQDELFGGYDYENGQTSSMLVPGRDDPDQHTAGAIWPGLSKPGMWMSYVSDLCQVALTFESQGLREYEENPIPPVLNNCTYVLTRDAERAARDEYWSVVSREVTELSEVIATLRRSHEHNPFAPEPLVVLSQQLMQPGPYLDFDAALDAARSALELQQQWGAPWDKRLSFGAWVAWTRVLAQRAANREAWPKSSWDVNNFGLVE